MKANICKLVFVSWFILSTNFGIAQTINFMTSASNNSLCFVGNSVSIDATQTTPLPGAAGYWWFVKGPANPCVPNPFTVSMGSSTFSFALIEFRCCGVYTISHMAYYATHPLADDSVAHTFTVVCAQQASISLTGQTSGSIICAGNSASLLASGASSYSWSTGSNAQAIYVAPSSNSTYSVVGTDQNGCKSTASISISLDPCLGLEDNSFEKHIVAFPNPAFDRINLNYNGTGRVQYLLLDLMGKTLRKGSFEGFTEIETSTLNTGNYVLFLQTETGSYYKRVSLLR